MALPISGQISMLNIYNEAFPLGYYITQNTSVSALESTAWIGQMTLNQNASVDNGSISITLPWSITFQGVTYNSVYIGSNSYITFGGGSNAYSSLSETTPPYPKIMISSADNSYQRVYSGYIGGGTTKFAIRYEGTASTSGTIGSPNILWEAVFINTDTDRIHINIGQNARGTSGVSGVATATAWLLRGSLLSSANSFTYIDVLPTTNMRLNALEILGYGGLNPNAIYKPNGSNPNAMSEWRGYNRNATPVYTHYIGLTNYSTSTDACNSTAAITTQVYSSSEVLVVGSELFLNPNLTNGIGSSSYYHRYTINTGGIGYFIYGSSSNIAVIGACGASSIQLNIYLSFYDGSGNPSVANYNSFSIDDNTTSTRVYEQTNINTTAPFSDTIYLEAGHSYTLRGFADESFSNYTVDVNWDILNLDDSYVQDYYSYNSTSGYGYENQDITIANPIPGTSSGLLEIYGSLTFLP